MAGEGLNYTQAQCSILKYATPIKCHFDCQRRPFFGGHFTKTYSTKFPPVTMKSSPITACHKIQWLQFANKNIVGLQSWHSNIHFQIPKTPKISTLQLRLNSTLTTTSAQHSRALFKFEVWCGVVFSVLHVIVIKDTIKRRRIRSN